MSNTLTEWFRHVPEEKWLRDPAASRADAQAIWDKLDLTAGVRVFECPCGKADLSFPLARLGAKVSGIDFNSHFVSAAKNKFSRAGLSGEFKTDDMRTAQFPEQMDLIINWASSFGYFSDKDNADLLARLQKPCRWRSPSDRSSQPLSRACRRSHPHHCFRRTSLRNLERRIEASHRHFSGHAIPRTGVGKCARIYVR